MPKKAAAGSQKEIAAATNHRGVGELEVVEEEMRGVVEVGEEALQSSCFLSKGAYINTVGIYNHSENIEKDSRGGW